MYPRRGLGEKPPAAGRFLVIFWKKSYFNAIGKGGVEDTRLDAKAKDTKKSPRRRIALPKTDPLEAKNRNSRGQDQGHRRKCSPKKSVFKNFSGVLQKKSLKKFLWRSPSKKTILQIIFFQAISETKVFKKNFQVIYKILIIQKLVLSSSRGLEASRPRPRPRTSKCVLETKVVLEDSTSGHWITFCTCSEPFERTRFLTYESQSQN